MRTTLALDDDIFLLAKQHATRERVSLGRAVSDLVRRGVRAPSYVAPLVAREPSNPYVLIEDRGGERITSEYVRQLMDEEGI